MANSNDKDVAELLAREKIRELRAQYCWYVARSDYASVVSLFTPDGMFEVTVGGKRVSGKGTAELTEMLATRPVPSAVYPMIHNEFVVINGDEAIGACAMEAKSSNPEFPGFSGYYHDKFRFHGGQWLFSERRFYTYWPTFEFSGLDMRGNPQAHLTVKPPKT